MDKVKIFKKSLIQTIDYFFELSELKLKTDHFKEVREKDIDNYILYNLSKVKNDIKKNILESTQDFIIDNKNIELNDTETFFLMLKYISSIIYFKYQSVLYQISKFDNRKNNKNKNVNNDDFSEWRNRVYYEIKTLDMHFKNSYETRLQRYLRFKKPSKLCLVSGAFEDNLFYRYAKKRVK